VAQAPEAEGKNIKYEMADTLWLGKSLKALAARTSETTIEDLPVEAGQTAPTDRTIIEYWLVRFFGDLVDLHTDKIRRAVTLATNLLGDNVRGDESIWKDSIEDRDERTMKVRLLDKFEKAFQDSAKCICTGPFGIDLRAGAMT
jgi:hypothetical protein